MVKILLVQVPKTLDPTFPIVQFHVAYSLIRTPMYGVMNEMCASSFRPNTVFNAGFLL